MLFFFQGLGATAKDTKTSGNQVAVGPAWTTITFWETEVAVPGQRVKEALSSVSPLSLDYEACPLCEPESSQHLS